MRIASSRGRRTTIGAGALGLALAAAACGQGGNVSDVDISTPDTADASGSEAPDTSTPTDGSTPEVDGVPDVVATIATGLDTPWGIDFLPDGRAVVTERDSARVLLVTPPALEKGTSKKQGTVTEVGKVPGVTPSSEGGLLGVAVSPSYESDSLVFLYASTTKDNRVLRATLDDSGLGKPEPILTGIPTGSVHNGGRLAFGPDGYLYVSTGDGGEQRFAQRPKSVGGKILRITTDGEPAPQNPFDTVVWSLGHRNVQGLAFDPQGSLWASEFGEKLADELNRILPGENYGWPEVEGAGGPKRFTQPALTWPTPEASPSGLAYASGYLWMASLQGERLWRIKVAGGQVSDPTAYFAGDEAGEYGRLRTVVRAPDGRLWLTTSNQDGRGDPAENDDRILLIDP